MSTSGSKSNEHVAHFLVDIHNLVVATFGHFFINWIVTMTVFISQI